MRFASSLIALLLAVSAGSALAQEPGAAEAPAVGGAPALKTGVSSVLGTLDWGASHSQVLARLRVQIDERYARALEDVRDPLEIDRALQRKADEYARIEQTYLRFSGEHTGYESSLIAQDFVADSEESVLRVDDRDAQRYYFFKNDRLWKVLVAYNTGISRSVPFGEFVRQVQQKYERPVTVEKSSGQDAVRSATWRDDLTELVVEDRTEFFGAFVMKFLDRAKGVELEAERTSASRKARTAIADDPLVSATLAEITAGGDGQDGGDESVVDRLTGVTHDVDLQRGRPEYEFVNGGPVASPTYPEAAPGKKGKREAAGPRDKKAGPSPAPAKPAEQPFIIY